MDTDSSGSRTSGEHELYIIIAKFLEGGPCKKAAELLKKEIEENGLVPPRTDWEGNQHEQSLSNYMTSNSHIASDHLSKICHHFSNVLEKVVPPSVSGVRTLLGAGRLSLLRTVEDVKFTQWPGKMNAVLRNQQPLLHPHNLKHAPNLCQVLHGRELCGANRHDRLLPISMYDSHMSMHVRVLGHLSAVFCVLFDKTGLHILTGADDGLIKLWSTKDCRLLFTFRGHSGEVSDMAINHENTILASGSCDKTLRIWCLKTGAQIAVLQGHGSAVTSVQFCPLIRGEIRYLVSTGGDGCVCFWKYTEGLTYEFEGKPVKFIERSRAGAQMICQSFSPGGVFVATGSTDQSIRVYSFLSLHPEKISEVDPHTDRVDSIQFSNRGDRFMSGSKDGTARIWRYQRQEWHFMTLSMTAKLKDTPESDEPKPKLKVNMVRWSYNDDYVITAVSDCSIKLWNSWTGALICVMEGHDDEVFVIEVNPVDSRIILTAGHDGKINLWSIPDGRLIRTFTNNIPGQGHGAVFDCKFSPDGQTIAATDSHGHLIMFGMGSSDPYMRVPNEQFFHTDYRPLIRDGQGFVLDEQTQQPPHLMPPPFLVDMDGCPHPIQYQRLVPGRENCKDSQLIPQIGTAENGDREVVGDNLLDAEIIRLNNGNVDELDFAIASFRMENDFRNNVPPFGSPDRQPGVRRASGNVPVSRVATNQDLLYSSKRRIVRALDRASLIRCRTQRQAHAESELARFLRERKQKPLPVSRSDSSDGGYNIKTRRKKKGRGRAAYVNQMEDTAVNRLVTRALYDTEPEDESSTTDPQPEENGRNPEPVYESEDGDGAESSDYSDWMADAQVNLQPPLRTSNRNRKRPRVPLLSSDAESDNESVASSTHSSTRPARKRKPPKKNQSDAQPSTSSLKVAKMKRKTMKDFKDIKELPPQFLPPEWLTGVLPRKAPYAPQMGDEVVYLRQGHQLYVDAVNRSKSYKIDVKTLPYIRNPSMRDAEYVKVIGIKYEVRPPRLACLKLGYLNPMTGNLMKESFTIKYHDMPDVLDFLVLRQTFDLANERHWKVGDRFCSIIDDAWWMGTIDKQGPLDKKFPESPFQCFHVKWDNGESELMSPWDMEPLEDHRIPSEKGASKPLSAEDHAALTYHPKESEWPPCGRAAECDRLVEGLQNHIMQLSIAEPFLAPVDLKRYPIYAIVIEYLIDLTTIKCRLENRYYRRISALQFDVRYIEMNARKFNETGSEIIKRAKSITKLSLEFIRQNDCDDPMRLFQGMKKDGEADSGSETEIEGENGEGAQKRSAQDSDTSPPRKRARNDYVVTSESWKQQSRQLLLAVMDMDDSTPFREPVNTELYPQYIDVISEPMDLGTVLRKLDEGHYPDPQELQCDLRLIFKNAKAFNSKKSKIYTMTLRLSAHIEEKFRNIISDWKSAVRCERNTRSSSMVKPRSARSTAVVAPVLPSTSGTSDPGPSTSGLRSRAPRTRSSGVIPSENVKQLNSSSDEASTDPTSDSGSDTEVDNDHESAERVWGKRKPKRKPQSAAATSLVRKTPVKRTLRKRKDKYEEEEEEEVDSEATDVNQSDTTEAEVSDQESSDTAKGKSKKSRRIEDTDEEQSDSSDDKTDKERAESSDDDEDESPRTRAKRYATRRRPNGVTNGSVKAASTTPGRRDACSRLRARARSSRRSRGNPRYCEDSEEEDAEVEPAASVSSRGRVRKMTEKARRAHLR